MVQCKIFTGIFPENEINNFLVDHPEWRYISHSHSSVIHQGNAWTNIVLFYETNPHTVIRTGPNSVKSISHE